MAATSLSTAKYPDLGAATNALLNNSYKIIMPDISDDQLQQALLQTSYGGGGGGDWIKSEARAFFLDPENLFWAKEMMLLYERGIPAYDDHNNWDDQYKFVKGAKIMKTINFNIYPTSADCAQVNSCYVATQQLIKNLQQENATGVTMGVAYNYQMDVLQKISSYLNGKFSSLDCQNILTQQEQQQQLAAVSAAASTGTSSGNKSNYVMYFIYGVAALMLIAGIMILFKRKKK